MIGIKKAVLKNKTMDVLSMVEFDALYNRARSTEDLQSITQDVCVQVGDYVYPVTLTPKTGSGVWMYANDVINVLHGPETEEEKEEYSANQVIDLSSDSVKDLKDNIMAMDKLKNAEISRLSMIKSVLELPIQDDDTMELQAIKRAINAKQIDPDSYKAKFPSDSDFNNDMRALKSSGNNNISFFKAKRIMNAFDLEMELTIRDKEGVVNPIGEEITVTLTD